ncbi:CdaR family transcriptional regulator [Lacticaseibacillus suihuaensis]
MELDPKIAEEIVTSLKSIINYEINLFDTHGEIVASTDKKRIGTSHQAALIAARENRSVNVDATHPFPGSKTGTNMPIVFDDLVVAVIGITGELQAVLPFGNVIRRMTEVLLRENWEQTYRFNRQKNYQEFFELFLSRHPDLSYVHYLAAVLNVDLGIQRRAVVGRFDLSGPSPVRPDELDHVLTMRLAVTPNTVYALTNQELRLLVADSECPDLALLLHQIGTDLAGCGRPIQSFGIGDTAVEGGLSDSVQQAMLAAKWGQFERVPVQHFCDLDTALVYTAISDDEAQQVVNKVLGKLTAGELIKYHEVFNEYTATNGSLEKGAARLFMHKNTFQNRLNQLGNKTGYNPRNLRDFAALQMAFTLLDYQAFLTHKA